ncbi:restriction endonuclease subunit S [Nocardia harenae]|uniref:restriction endonuclease subunit S n=1 Tax=Nocardia harenae TaxID=358707 RepID=UPI000A03F483|nr:restriction endonuclease subunit S [Nocardia harenae]
MSAASAIPTLRVKQIATKIGSGKTPSGGSETYSDSGVLFIRSQNVQFGALNLTDIVHINDATHRDMYSTRVHDGDVLLNITGASLGRVAYYRAELGEANVNQHVCIIRPQSSMDTRYLSYALSSDLCQDQIAGMQAGGNRDGLNFEQVGGLRLPVPSLEMQRRIADFLDAEISRLDRLAALRKRVRELVELRNERLVDTVLWSGLSNHKRRTIPLKYLAQEISVGIVVTPAKWYVDSDGVPALRGINVRPGHIDLSDLANISIEGHTHHSKSRLSVGDVVVVRTGQAGAAAVVPPALNGANCIDLIIIRCGSKLSPDYLQYVINSAHTRNTIAEYSVGSIQSHFNVSSMKQVGIPCRTRNEQDDIVLEIDTSLQQGSNAIELLRRQEALLSERRKSLVLGAITGMIDITTASGRNLTKGI